ncbi:hypothetical protein VIBHAR_06728 [Vibrio campbellii ATCC BAA-1116]|uniref:Uncharacterized protein n=1 Tax=Vibrio campbellii (strain ATCC BAA-1116) TaxID=2902295 RepID=A7N2A2_VIBC1|nr:hypothetical protein VIBHAR_06728 [Vibrio campbellii ATCC BAA-1116]
MNSSTVFYRMARVNLSTEYDRLMAIKFPISSVIES